MVGQGAKGRNDLEEEYEERDQEVGWYTVTGKTGERPSRNLSRETSWLDKTVGNYTALGNGVLHTGVGVCKIQARKSYIELYYH